jgi:hypothetical protein
MARGKATGRDILLLVQILVYLELAGILRVDIVPHPHKGKIQRPTPTDIDLLYLYDTKRCNLGWSLLRKIVDE